jgi:hypothetical protein
VINFGPSGGIECLRAQACSGAFHIPGQSRECLFKKMQFLHPHRLDTARKLPHRNASWQSFFMGAA